MADGIRNQQWYLKPLKVSEAHGVSTGAGITVAVIDTGVSPHRDFGQNLLAGSDQTTGKPNGRVDLIGHGTAMAGIIAAAGRGNSGVIGIAPAAKILPLRVSPDNKSGEDLVAGAIDYAVSHKAQVVNISLGFGPDFNLAPAISNAQKANAVIVAGAGNNGLPQLEYPAAMSGVLAVGATDKSGKHASYSNTGSKVQICAPGTGIFSTGPKNNNYFVGDGTSNSTAIVSGAVALVRAKFPQLSAADVIHRITATADDIGPPGRDQQCGFGELNIVKALTANVPPLTGDSGAGSASASAGADVPSAAAPTDGVTTPGNVAAPSADNTSSSAPLIIGIVVIALVIVGLLGFMVLRRGRRP